MKGYVYILKNQAMPGLLKIGRSANGAKMRANQLYTTGVPVPFEIAFETYSHDCEALEKELHWRLQNSRCSDNREFFKVSEFDAIQCLMGAQAEMYHLVLSHEGYKELADAVFDMCKRANINHFFAIETIKALSPEVVREAHYRWSDEKTSAGSGVE